MQRNPITRRSFLERGSQSLATVATVLCLDGKDALANLKLAAPKQRPYLLIGASEYPGLREKLARDPSRKIYENYTRRLRGGDQAGRSGDGAVEPLLLWAIVNQDKAAMTAAGKALMQALRASRRRAEIILSGETGPGQQGRAGANGPAHDFSGLRYLHRLMNQYDVVDGFAALSIEEQREFQQHIFWAVEKLTSPEFKAINSRYPDRRHNFHTDNITVIGTAALCFPEHPRAQEWLEYALVDFAWQMEHGVEDGAWHEVPRYHGAILRSLIPLAYALRRNTKIDWFANQGFRALLDWLVRCQTPRDRVYGKHLRDGKVSGANGAETMAYAPEGVCQSPGVGDAEWVNYWFAALGMAAPAYKDSDPEFAARLTWGWERAGGPYAPESNLLFAPLLVIDPTIKAAPQKMSSEVQRKIGYAILRSNYDQPDEKYLFFTSGHRREEHWAGHSHRDLNSFSLFAEGVPLALDAGSGPYRTQEHALWHKASISHNTVIFGGRDHDIEDGRILQFVSSDAADYVVGDAGRSIGEAGTALQFYRHILFVKPDYFVVWDFIRSWVFSEWLLHSPASEIKKSEHSLGFVTPWGVSLDAHFLLPKEPLKVWEGEGRFGAWRSPTDRGAPPFTHQKYVKVRNEPGKDFLTILHPRKEGQLPLSAQLIGSEENVLEVKLDGRTDYVLLLPVNKEFKDESRGIAFSGRVGVIRDGQPVLLDGVRLSYRGREAAK